MDREKVLRLIVIEDDANDAERMISAIKSGGYAVRARHVQDEEQLADALKNHAPDIALCAMNAQSVSLGRALECIRESGTYVPVISLANGAASDVVDCMQKGAVDLVDKVRTEHIKLVVARTAEAQRQWREMKRLEADLRESERRCRTLLDSSRDSICYVHEGMHVYANLTYLALFGYSDLADIEGTPIMDMVAPDHQCSMKEFLRKLEKDADKAKYLEIDLRHAGGKIFSARLEFSPASIDGEPCTQIVIHHQSDESELAQQLDYLSQREAATGLYNRTRFMELLKSAVADAAQGRRSRALIQVELDNVAAIKDAVGVGAIDLIVADVAKLLDGFCDEADTLARFSEHVFTILTPRWETAALESFMRQMSEAVAQHTCEVEDKSVIAQATISAVQIDENAPDADELLARAEKACVEARQNRCAHSIYRASQGEMTQKQLDEVVATRLLEAIKHMRLRLLFQPIVSLRGDPGERYEAFLRVFDAQGAEMDLPKLLPSAERTGIVKKLDRWVLTHAIDRLAQTRASGKDTTFFVKLTAGTLQDPTLLPWLSGYLRDKRVPPTSLVLSIKEQVVVNYLKHAKALIKGLHEMHSRFALDDFGTGLNPFQLLKAVPADFLKVDKSLMENITNNAENQDALRTIVDISNSMNKVTIAPYIEDAAALPVLWGIGINLIQGYFLQVPSEELNYDFSALG